VKANLNWEGSNATSILSVYDTPSLNWKLESARIASTWLAGPPAEAITLSMGANSTAEHAAIAG
jgi:hypothetical protein